MTAIELTGTINEHSQLELDESLPVSGPIRVRVIVLYPISDQNKQDEKEWLKAAASNPAFSFLHDSKEDIYSLTDGEPFHDQA